MSMEHLEGGDWKRIYKGSNDSLSKVHYYVEQYPTVSFLIMERKI